MAKPLGGLRGRIRRWTSWLKDQVIQDTPPELEACEACGKLECAGPEWETCEKRLAVAQFARTPDDAALARVERAYGWTSSTALPPPTEPAK